MASEPPRLPVPMTAMLSFSLGETRRGFARAKALTPRAVAPTTTAERWRNWRRVWEWSAVGTGSFMRPFLRGPGKGDKKKLPKFEIRNPKEVRSQKSEERQHDSRCKPFWLRISGFGFTSTLARCGNCAQLFARTRFEMSSNR
jgi:hypothetical protein